MMHKNARPMDSATLTHRGVGCEGIPGRPGHSAKTAKGRRRMARAEPVALDGPPLLAARRDRMEDALDDED